jgi:hypothetical protein
VEFIMSKFNTNTVVTAPVLFIVGVRPARGADIVEVVVDATSYGEAESLALRQFPKGAEVGRRPGGMPMRWKATASGLWRAAWRSAMATWRNTAKEVDDLLGRMADECVGDIGFFEDALAMTRAGAALAARLEGFVAEGRPTPPIEDICPLPQGMEDRIKRSISPQRQAGVRLDARRVLVARMGTKAFAEAEAAARGRRAKDLLLRSKPIRDDLKAQGDALRELIEEGVALLGRAVGARIIAAKAAHDEARRAAKEAEKEEARVAARAASRAAMKAVADAARAAEDAERAEDARTAADIMAEFGLA